MKKKLSSKPTQSQYGAYQAAWDYFNKTLFDGELSPCLLSFGRKNRMRGMFYADRWGCVESVSEALTTGRPVSSKRDICHEIVLNPDVLDRPIEQTMSTLVHEMCHQWQFDHGKPPRSGYHDTQWATKMMEVGLVPSDTGEPGGKTVGQGMSHYIMDGGAFSHAIERMPEDCALPWLSSLESKKSKKAAKKVKYRCVTCRAQVWGKAGLEIACIPCRRPYESGVIPVDVEEDDKEDDD
jgi:predicted SprT family Zn-dependent metalloprotease